ncbi:hypothetical protein [Ohtaekwangia koreensis]|uniref:HMA domain-containing protein n=1 Tax=Ohtaekwangia koreensis TaxID=688867 RepID=A0A1T5JLR4_9BACT|nr:hypothetical protein [Ohtaekwangia koreensis]SKC52073.1 hypothetical protein SAMN05660236_1208 [Ohtaekwangia koreensis]
MIILLFKTNLACSHDVDRVTQDLNQLTGKNNWSVDIGDEDKVLRILVNTDVTNEIFHLLNKNGYTCEPLK